MLLSGSFLGLRRDSAPSSSPLCCTASARQVPAKGGRPPSAPITMAADGGDPCGQVAAERNSAPTRIQASARSAPVAPASTATIRLTASVKSSCPAMSRAKSDRAW